MKKEEVLGILQDNAFVLEEEKKIQHGVQLTSLIKVQLLLKDNMSNR